MQEAPKNVFDISGVEHRRIVRYKPEYIGAGGYNVVYSLPSYPDLVAKVNTTLFIEGIERNALAGREINLLL